MSDADGRIIPLVEGDQGEGIKDFLDDHFMEPAQKVARTLALLAQHDATIEKREAEGTSLQDIADRLTRLERLIEHIFGGHVLINGRFVEIK